MTNVPQELVLSDKKGEIVLSDGRFVSVFKTKVRHVLLSKDKDETVVAIKLISLVTTVDDKPFEINDIVNLSVEDFKKIAELVFK
jgi:hypothetical protein